jgi:Uri superfamily endonuclease
VIDPKAYRARQIKDLTDQIGVYALCDLDGVPIYVGESVDGIRSRVRRHLTSARSDIIANRMIDVWEIAYVKAWPVTHAAAIPALEAYLFATFDAQNQLMNGKGMISNTDFSSTLPEPQIIQVIAEDERLDRLRPAQRLPRQIAHYLSLVDYIQTVKDERHLKRSLQAHFDRLVAYHTTFLS